MDNSIVAVWGNDGAGKSLLACAVANRLANKDKAAIVISTSKQAPMFCTYLPMTEEKGEYSLGRLLSGTVTIESLKNTIHIHPENSNLGFMSLVRGDNALIYQGNWRLENIQQLVDLLFRYELAAYIVFDCSTDILADNGTLYALEKANAVVRISSPDNRGISFVDAQTPVLRGGNFRYERQISVLNNVYPYSPTVQIVKDRGFEFVFPHTPSANKKYIAGQVIKRLEGIEGCKFEDELNRLVERVVDSLGR